MLPGPRAGRNVVAPPSASTNHHSSKWSDLDDDEGWQDMPVIRSDDFTSELDAIDDKKYHYKPPMRLDSLGDGDKATGNATGAHLELDPETTTNESWRQKAEQDESEYTRVRLDEDEESEEVHMRTRYLFDEGQAMTPLSQMQATKELLTEAQRIAYVGLCHLVAGRIVRDMGRGWEGTKAKRATLNIKGKGRVHDVACVESGKLWMIKMMARLYQHMELERDEQRMIESLAEHGVDPSDLVPALMTTHTVKNPEFDPAAKKAAEDEAEAEAAASAATDKLAEAQLHGHDAQAIDDPAPPYTARTPSNSTPSPPDTAEPSLHRDADGDADDDGDIASGLPPPIPPKDTPPAYEIDDDDGDIGAAISPPQVASPTAIEPETPVDEKTATVEKPEEAPADGEKTPTPEKVVPREVEPLSQESQPMPALPGVSTSVTAADEMVTLDIRWTVLCDLFLILIADSLYDARSRTFLERVANALGFGWLDVVRFENRVTDALEIQEAVGQLMQEEVIDSRRKSSRKKRYAIMGAATVGGALVIGLSAGLLAPLIGAGLGAAFTTIGIGGTSAFLTGAGGAAVITTTGVLTGANIAGRGIAKRTREVRVFELKPIHNNKRVSCYITVGGFMASKVDDVRLPFSVLDPIAGDVFSVLWEPEMLNEMGTAIKLLTTEVLTQLGQQVLAATIMGTLMSALAWPMALSKLGYLIDNPWSNALDRAKAAGLVLADVLLQRHAGVRPTSLIGFSLGARVIFYALVELARVKAYGIVQDVYLFGATVTAPREQWREVRSVISGRFVNGFASNDWMLGYLFRAASGFSTVAGLRPIEDVPGVENVDVTELISGHMSYRSCMPLLLKLVGFPVTAEWFDEPEDPDLDMSVQERYIVNEEEEKAKKMEKERKKILGIFPRKTNGSGQSTPRASSSEIARKSQSPGGAGAAADDDDDLPPREDEQEPPRLSSEQVPDEADLGERPPVDDKDASRRTSDDASVRDIPKTAGFDFAAIAKELGKEIDIDHLRDPSVRSPGEHPVRSVVSPLSNPERTGSAPPLSTEADLIRPPRSTSVTATAAHQEEEDDDGDIAITAQRALALDVPQWDRPWASSSGANLPLPSSFSSTAKPSGFFSFNAWGAPSGASTSPTPSTVDSGASGNGVRAAPPARPHPPELFSSNPFADDAGPGGLGSMGAGSIGGSGMGGGADWRKKADEKLAMENPW